MITTAQTKGMNKIGWVVMCLLAVLMFVLASRYLTFNPEVFFPQQRAVYLAHAPAIMLHIVGSMLATILGPWQFVPKIRTRPYLNVHRWLGRVYLLGVLVGGLGGFYMALIAYGGWAARVGFVTLAVLWLFSGYRAYQHIRRRELQQHRAWMIRNYALTFAAVTLRLWQVVFQIAGLEFVVGYIIVAWLSWIPNLIVAEWMIKRDGLDLQI